MQGAGEHAVYPGWVGMPRQLAESEAVRGAILKFKITDIYGSPPTNCGGVLIGAEGETINDLKRVLRQLHGDRLIQTH